MVEIQSVIKCNGNEKESRASQHAIDATYKVIEFMVFIGNTNVNIQCS